MIYDQKAGWNTGDTVLDNVLNNSESYEEYGRRVGAVNALSEDMWIKNTLQTFEQLSEDDRLARAYWLKAGCPRK